MNYRPYHYSKILAVRQNMFTNVFLTYILCGVFKRVFEFSSNNLLAMNLSDNLN